MKNRSQLRHYKNLVFAWFCLLMTVVCVSLLGLLMGYLLAKGIPWMSWDLINNFPSRFPEQAGIKPALYGTLWILMITATIAIPIGVSAAIYLEEYEPKGWLSRFIEFNIANLVGAPPIIYGILGLAIFVRFLALDRSILAGSLTLVLLALPLIIITAREAIRNVPKGIREAAYALGATRWQVVRQHVLPLASSGIMTGTILAMARIIGETAPLLMIGALTYITFTPNSVFDPFTVLPIQLFNWSSRPCMNFQGLAAAGVLILLAILLVFNAIAIYIRFRSERTLKKL